MNTNISFFYSGLIENGNATEEDVFDALLAGIKNDDAGLVNKCLNMIHVRDDGHHPQADEFAVNEMASGKIISLLEENGYSFGMYPPRISLFSLTPSEMVSFFRKHYAELGDPYEEVFAHISYYHKVRNNGESVFRVPFDIDEDDGYRTFFASYMDSWCCDFLDLVSAEATPDTVNKIRRGLFYRSIADPDMKRLLKKTLPLLKRKWMKRDINRLLDACVRSDNEAAFDAIMEFADRSSLELSVYPEKNMKLLRKIFGLEQLTPGTDEAYKAFTDYVWLRKTDPAVLKAVMHPSYCRKQNECGMTALMYAVANDNFAPTDYHILIGETPDLEIRNKSGSTALLIAATDNPDGIAELISIGADPYAKDMKGNNALHLMALKNEFCNIVNALRFIPHSLLEDRNESGMTPMDVIRNRIIGG